MIKFSIKFLLTGLLVILFFVQAQNAFAEAIKSFDVTGTLWNDGHLDINEVIKYDFGDQFRHGIYRDIPQGYTIGIRLFETPISQISVTDENGKPHPFEVQQAGSYTRIKIGDPTITKKGEHTYVISYRFQKFVIKKDALNLFRLNVTGNEWQVPIEKSSLRLNIPTGILKSTDLLCYRGIYKSSDTCKSSYIGRTEQTTSIISVDESNLGFGEGYTVEAHLPPETVSVYLAGKFYLSFWFVFNTIVSLIIVIFFYFLWREKGRDAKGAGTVIAQFSPLKDLTPAESGALVDNTIHQRDLAAEILYLATMGYLTIEYVAPEKKLLITTQKEDFIFRKVMDISNNDHQSLKLVMKRLFEKSSESKLSKLSAQTSKLPQEIHNKIWESLVSRKYFTRTPITMIVGVMLFILFIAFPFLALPIWPTIVIAFICAIIYSILYPQRTKKGSEAREYLLGLKLYVATAEKDRLKFHNAPEKNAKHFEELLPYAVAFGLEEKWGEAFKGITMPNPSWYNDTTMSSGFNYHLFSSHVHNFSNNMSIGHAPKSSGGIRSGGGGFSSGGGFSGGGGGGGGGGSW